MAISVQSLFKERKYPFVFTLSLLFFFVFFILLSTNNQFSSFSKSISSSQTSSSSSSSTPQDTSSSSLTPLGNVSSSETDADRINADDHHQMNWTLCEGPLAVDYIPCLDNYKAIKALKSKAHMEHRERHCPSPSPSCLVPLPRGYKPPIPWPKSRDMIWYDNVPHPKLVEYKKEQNWVRKKGDYLVFPGGGTQFKEGVANYINFIRKTLPVIKWGKSVRVVLDIGCGVASFGGYLLDENVITMSFAPKDEHEAQIQFALERGIPAILSVIGTQQLNFPDNAFDLLHCARCRVHWHDNGGKLLWELNRVLRPGGFFLWSATPVYYKDKEHQNVWKAMVALTKSMCWKVLIRTVEKNGIGIVVYQKPDSSSCYESRKENVPPLCDENYTQNQSWYTPLKDCLTRVPVTSWPSLWPQRLSSKPPSLSSEPAPKFFEDTKHWSTLVSDVYRKDLAINWPSVRNVMDMNAGYGGFAAALVDQPLWVMNVVPVDGPDHLSIIFDRGLIGIYHDWCESFNTYPRTYDLLHSSFLFGNLKKRCDIIGVVVEMDRMLRPGGWILVQDTIEMINKLTPIMQSLHWTVNLHQDQFLVGKKGLWRPSD